MGFTAEFIKTLANKDEIRHIKYFMQLPVGIDTQIGTTNQELDAKSVQLAELASGKKVAPLIANESFKGKSYSEIFKSLYEYSVDDIEEIIQHLQTLPSSSNLKHFIIELKEFNEGYRADVKAKYHPKGLYGCLRNVNLLLSGSTTIESSLPFQQALLTGAVIPLLSLFEDLESTGDLTVESLPKLAMAKGKMLEALTQFNAIREKELAAEMKQLEKINQDALVKALKPNKDKIEELTKSLAKLKQSYQDEKENLSADQIQKMNEDIKTMSSEIDDLNRSIAQTTEKLNKFLTKKKEEVIQFRKNEARVLDLYFTGMSDELDYIRKSVMALEKKHAVDKKYPLGSDADLSHRKKAIRKLQKETGLNFLLSDDGSIQAKKLIKKYGGKLLYNQSQSRIAAMAHSEGLCGGYTAEFLEICSSAGWDGLSFADKMRRFKPIVANKGTIKLTESVNLAQNDLWMTLESGLRWDVQSNPTYKNNATIYEIKTGDKSHAKSSKESENVKAFHQKWVDNMMLKLADGKPAKLMIWIYGSKEGHAIGVNYDKDGILFHDSNTGYIRFENKDQFALFMVDYLSKNYPDLTDHCWIYDFDTIRKNISSVNFKLKRADSTLTPTLQEEVSSQIKLQSVRLLQRAETVQSKIDSAQETLETVRSQRQLKSPQELKLDQVTKKEKIQALSAHYLRDFDDVLKVKPVLKQKLFHEIQFELSQDKPSTENLRGMCRMFHLPKCGKMLDEVEQVMSENLIHSRVLKKKS